MFAFLIQVPEASHQAEEGNCGVQGIEFAQALGGEFPAGDSLFAEAVMSDDGLVVFSSDGFLGAGLEQRFEFVQHDGAAGVGALVAEAEAECGQGISIRRGRQILKHGILIHRYSMFSPASLPAKTI